MGADITDSSEPAAVLSRSELPASQFRWICDPGILNFKTTADIEPVRGVIGQESAVEALRFGLETTAPGQNIFVRGLHGSGRMTLVRNLLTDLKRTCHEVYDYCYVYNFHEPQRPALVKLPRGMGRQFRKQIDNLIDFITRDLSRALSSDRIRERHASLSRRAEERIKAITEPFEKKLEEAGFALVTIDAGQATQLVIMPTYEGKPIGPEEYDQLFHDGKITKEQYEEAKKKFESFAEEFREVGTKVQEIRSEQAKAMGDTLQNAARDILASKTKPIREKYNYPAVITFLDGLIEDFVETRLPQMDSDRSFLHNYRVNVIREHSKGDDCPIVVENVPTLSTLLGSIDAEMVPGGVIHSDHTMICAGSILRADGGFLILEAADVLAEPAAWKMLMRTLRTGQLEIIPRELANAAWGRTIKPEPIPLNIKVILLGDSQLFAMLDAYDTDFRNLFKVLADFDPEISRAEESIARYAGVLARIAREENLPPFDAPAVAQLVEHGARIASRAGKLTTRFSRLADIAREAAFLTTSQGRTLVTLDDVKTAIKRTKQRADLPSRRFREYIADGTIVIDTQGKAAGQINGLAVLQAGPLTYGFPARISATVGPGNAGIINIERESQLSGAIHTKGFNILRGLLRHLLRAEYPPTFSASLVFEQSYGGIDGDSASGAETCCLISALTGVPIRQDLAMTGAIDQFGNILAIGGVNEKIEGFFDTCRDKGLTGTQGVIIPRSNAGELMLREDVVQAGQEGKFHIYTVDHITDALTILTGLTPGRRDPQTGEYPEGTLLRLAVDQIRCFWEELTKARLVTKNDPETKENK